MSSKEKRETDQQPLETGLPGAQIYGGTGGTNLDGENLITVQTCICVVWGSTLGKEGRMGGDVWEGRGENRGEGGTQTEAGE